ncbi:hypothetical protein AP064_02860 [Candidatus Liberibacter solanacearum]|uniref:Uncharacterized protein n=1 Tax=Liberibacter solanacearum (strain CLso-ZC1) TaxID=658172 RepID=E4UC36_LIBSC|nr:hypothetical protein [Candidatus Liberibacter solanacearum]ADR51926.1 hypothetical protein CKC_00875 [Candidatus Liberibacter solanacearum CLso-ZC1]KQC49021.1 hypothetical protein AP064_02860 [Candidatus Liberibacter solanacearum]
MTKRQEQYVTKQEFNELSAKVDCIITHLKVCERSERKQQQGIEEILNILQGLKWFFASIKNIAIIVTSLSAILYGVFNIKGWLKQ